VFCLSFGLLVLSFCAIEPREVTTVGAEVHEHGTLPFIQKFSTVFWKIVFLHDITSA